MCPLIVLLLIAAQAWSFSVSSPRTYDSYSVFRAHITTRHQHQVIDQLLEQHDKYNLWHRSVNEVHIMVSPRALKSFREIMFKAYIGVELMIPNVQILIDGQRKRTTEK